MIFGFVKGQNLKVKAAAAADTIDYLTAKFSFLTADWDGLVKYAHFARGDERYSVQLTDDEVREEDHLNLSSGEWTVYLHGNEYRNGDVIKRITTNVAKFTVEPTGTLDGEPFPETDPSVVEQIAADVADHEERITAIEEAGGADNVKDVQDSEGNSIVDPDTKIATLPEYESNIVDVQDEEGNSLVNSEKIAIVPAGGAVNDVQDAEGNSLVVDKIATLPVIPEYGKMFEIVDYTEGGNTYIKYTGTELYDLINDTNRDTVYCYYGKPIQYCRFVTSDDCRFAILTAGTNTLPSLLEYRLNGKRVVSSQNYGWTSETPYTVNEKGKLSLIEDRAEVNVINAIEKADGTAVTPVNKKITLPAQVVISDTEPTDTSVLWIDTSDDTVDGIDNGEEMSFPQEVGE